MDELSFWKQKLVQFFHDPPGKPFASYPKAGGHKQVARELYKHFVDLPFKHYNLYPDWAAAGADRPMLSQPKEKGTSPVQVAWYNRPILTHPLGDAQWQVDVSRADPKSQAPLHAELRQEQLEGLDQIKDPLFDWQNSEELKKGFNGLWRGFREALVAGRDGNLLWSEMPAESRIPDHSIWDHLRVTTALAFLPNRKQTLRDPNDPQCPWLLRFALHPVQRFIAEARTSRDLWLGSFLLADLIWHAMAPVVERYGYDCIIYPDLRGNPLVDNWLEAKNPDWLPDSARGRASFASLLPATFTALVPRGGDGDFLQPLEALAASCQEALDQRWQDLAKIVEDWLTGEVGAGPWQAIWQRQQRQVITATWSAVAWLPPEKLKHEASLRRRALPAQRADFRADLDAADLAAIQARKARLAPWMPQDVWFHYERARDVYAHTHLDWHQMERGFDYALTHHQLLARHALRRAQDQGVAATEEPGEKCTCCGRRQALTKAKPGNLNQDRKATREFWQHKSLDPTGTGQERLCGVCALKRFLVRAGKDKTGQLIGINPVWAGRNPAPGILEGKEVRAPFPSTATIAAQKFIAQVVAQPELAPQLRAIVQAHQAAELTPTSFPRALPRLAAAAKAYPVQAEFLKLEAEEVLFPEALRGQARGLRAKGASGDARARDQAQKLEALAKKVADLHSQARALKLPAPAKRIAVLKMDGDHLGRLLLGDPQAIHTTWRQVLHPEALRQVEEISQKPDSRLGEAGWWGLLDAGRLMGPSLHAYISRALANFSHHIVPWVVEREFSGRLIYAGGDELLCLVPGDEALGLAARLQQLFSAPWIVDTQAGDEEQWGWRHSGWQGDYDQNHARRRFALPVFKPGVPVSLPIKEVDQVHRHVVGDEQGEILLPELPVQGPVLPMLGPGVSLSAGIAFGHYKTPLSYLLERAGRMLDQEAKTHADRQAVALSHASRSGEKNVFAMKWGEGEAGAYATLNQVIRGFANGDLPGRLPYKLREMAPLVAALSPEEMTSPDSWLRGLFDAAAGEHIPRGLKDAAFRVWQQGVAMDQVAQNQGDSPSKSDSLERQVGGLLLCRALAGNEEEAE